MAPCHSLVREQIFQDSRTAPRPTISSYCRAPAPGLRADHPRDNLPDPLGPVQYVHPRTTQDAPRDSLVVNLTPSPNATAERYAAVFGRVCFIIFSLTQMAEYQSLQMPTTSLDLKIRAGPETALLSSIESKSRVLLLFRALLSHCQRLKVGSAKPKCATMRCRTARQVTT